MRRCFELYPFLAQGGVDSFDVLDAEINCRSALSLLTSRCHPYQQPDPAALKERHLWGSAKEEWDTEHVAVKRDATLEVLYRNQKLCDSRIGQIHGVFLVELYFIA